MTAPEPDLRTRLAAAFADEDARNWGYDHGFEPGDAETLAFADAAIAVMVSTSTVEPEPPDLAAIRARCGAATDGPWEYVEDNEIIVAGLERHSPGHISYDTLIVEVDGGEPGLDETESAYAARVEANATFVAAARTDVPALLDLAEQQAAEIERLREGQAFTADQYWVQVYELFGEWSSIGIGWSHEDRAIEDMNRMRQRDPGRPAMRVLRIRSRAERTVVVWEHPEDATGTRDASRAPESPADPAASNDPIPG